MNLNMDVFSVLLKCSAKTNFAILKQLQVNGEMQYTTIAKVVGVDSVPKIAYYLRKLRKLNAIAINQTNKLYKITERGMMIIKSLEELSEKYINSEPELICVNGDDLTHEFVTVCRNCGIIKEVKPLRIPLSKIRFTHG